MRQLAALVVFALMLPTTASGYTFGDWASDRGYNPGDAMPGTVDAEEESIDSLDGISDFDWTATPTTRLYLDENQISSIESGAFNGLTNLVALNLSSNQLSSVESSDFSGLTNLANLDLGGNELASIESGTFSHLTNLTRLDLEDSQLSSIEAGAFSGLTNLTSLDMEDNQLSSIESGVFSELASLAELYLDGNQLSSIESGAFNGLTNLTSLQLSDNQLSSIEPDAFNGLTNLAWLYLHSNELSSIEAGAFSGLTNLELLTLGYDMAISELNMAEADFSSLTTFSVRDNANIVNVSLKDTILNQTSLAAILDGGELAPWAAGIGELPGITEMDLSGIDFANITDLSPLYLMDDLTDFWLVNTLNLDASDLNLLLDNLESIEETSTEGVLFMTQANFDGFGDLLAAWNAEPGHHVEILVLGDMDGDGGVDFDDIDAFALGLIDARDYEDLYGMPPEWKGDTDADGDLDFDDIPGFVEMLVGVTAVPEPTSLLLILVGIAGLVSVGRRSVPIR